MNGQRINEILETNRKKALEMAWKQQEWEPKKQDIFSYTYKWNTVSVSVIRCLYIFYTQIHVVRACVCVWVHSYYENHCAHVMKLLSAYSLLFGKNIFACKSVASAMY